MKARILLPAIAVLSLLPSLLQAADAPPASGRVLLQPPKMSIASPITDRFALRGVYMRPDISTAVRYDSSAGVAGTLLTAEETLGQASRMDLGSVDMMFRIGERHRIHADFAKLTRHGDNVISQQIRFGDDVYLANDRVLSDMDLRKMGLVYTYSVLRRERVEIGLGLGLHLMQMEGTLDVPARFVSERLDTAGPFPTLATDLSWRVTRRFSLNGAVQYLHASIDEVKGGYQSWRADVQYRAWRNLAFGAGYSSTRYRIDSTDPDFAGYFNLKYRGPEVFVRASF